MSPSNVLLWKARYNALEEGACRAKIRFMRLLRTRSGRCSMDKLTRYRNLIKQALTERANLMRSQPLPGEEVVCLLDEATDNYLLIRLGWVRGKRLYSVTLHLRLA